MATIEFFAPAIKIFGMEPNDGEVIVSDEYTIKIQDENFWKSSAIVKHNGQRILKITTAWGGYEYIYHGEEEWEYRGPVRGFLKQNLLPKEMVKWTQLKELREPLQGVLVTEVTGTYGTTDTIQEYVQLKEARSEADVAFDRFYGGIGRDSGSFSRIMESWKRYGYLYDRDGDLLSTEDVLKRVCARLGIETNLPGLSRAEKKAYHKVGLYGTEILIARIAEREDRKLLETTS